MNAAITFAVCCCVLAQGSMAQGVERDHQYQFDVDEETLGEALAEISIQARIGYLHPYELAESRGVNPVTGYMTISEALDELLRGTEFSADLTESEVIVISRMEREPTEEMGSTKFVTALLAGVASISSATAYAQVVEDVEERGNDEVEIIEEVESDESEKTPLRQDVIVVTGTNIRGIAPDSSPVQVFSREDLQESGVSTIQDFLKTMPQNFGGGSNAEVVGGLPNDFSASYNSGRSGTYGSSANLRGLGAGSTLVLLNNHRVAPSSGLGDFVDISLFPASAIERMEVLTDGASSIYGGDAVAGVMNFILREDYDGAEAMVRYGSVTNGDLDEYRASMTYGKAWDGGNALVAYEYFNRGNLSAGDRSFSSEAILPNDLFPSSERNSVVAAFSQDILSNLRFKSDFLYGNRTGRRDWSGATYYIRILPDTTTVSSSAALEWNISENWTADFIGAYSKTDGDVNTEVDSSWRTDIESELWTLDAKASGILGTLWGVEVHGAFGGQYREESFSNVRVDIDTVQREADRNVSAVFGELYIPLISEEDGVAGAHRLDLSLSGRYEDYSDFGSQTTPKLGVLWSPVESLRLRASFGKSFNPPPLGRVGALDYTAFVAGTADINNVFGLAAADPSIADVTAIYVSGTARNLQAEESETFTAGFDFDKEFGAHRISLEATYLDIDFENRLGNTPVPNNRSVFDAPNIAWGDDTAFPPGTVVYMPSLDTINDLLNSVQEIQLRGDVDPLDAQIISTVQLTKNLTRTLVQGFDFSTDYGVDTDYGEFSLGVSGSYILEYEHQATPSTPAVSRIDTLYNPTHLRLRGRTGFAKGGLTTNLFVNYTNSYRFDDLPGSQKVDSFTTYDLSISYDLGNQFAGGNLGEPRVRFSVQNMFDTDPPATTNAPTFSVYGYDPTNASPLGRFVSIELSTKF
ncbi:TonB-dependent receptor domain-containing protein [Ponticaulis profundi]|uniref:TonB-dependent receptor domain-containing protein n=1 Tax=Ponticaulis profundi TaxID=2665222 RepID=A0ABW1SDX1_9PROT